MRSLWVSSQIISLRCLHPSLSKQSKGLATLRLDWQNSKRSASTSAQDELDDLYAQLDKDIVARAKLYQRIPPWFGAPVDFTIGTKPPPRIDLFGFSLHSFFRYLIARPSGIDLSRKAITEGSSAAFNAIAATIRGQSTELLGQYAYPHIVEMFHRFWTESKARDLDVAIEPALRKVIVRNMYVVMHCPLVPLPPLSHPLIELARDASNLLTNDRTFRLDPHTAYNPAPAEVQRLLDAPTATTIVPSAEPFANTMLALNGLLANGATVQQARQYLREGDRALIALPLIISFVANAFSWIREEFNFQANLVLKIEFQSLDQYSVRNTATNESILSPVQVDHRHCWEFMMPLTPHVSDAHAGPPRWRLWDINGSNAYLLRDKSTPLHVQKEILRMRTTLDPYFYLCSNELDGNKHKQHQIEHKFFIDALKEPVIVDAANATAVAAKNALTDERVK